MKKVEKYKKLLKKEVTALIEVLPKVLQYPTSKNYSIIRKRMISILYIIQWLEYMQNKK